MTTATATPAASLAEARDITLRLRSSVDEMLAVVAEAWERRVWVVLGHANWKTYLDIEVPEIADLKLPVAKRREVVPAWAAKGMSQPAMAAALNTSPATINADIKATVPVDAEAKLIGLDGKERTARTLRAVPDPAPVKRLSQVDRVVLLVTEAGERGITVKEVIRKTGWHHGTASAALSKAHNKRHAIRPSSTRRQDCNAYVLAD